MNRKTARTLAFTLVLGLPAVTLARWQSPSPGDRIVGLQEKLDHGEARLDFDTKFGYLPSLLRALKVPVSSQTLVFSKTSLQVDRIGPWAPRAIYFNDDVYI